MAASAASAFRCPVCCGGENGSTELSTAMSGNELSLAPHSSK